VGVEGRPCARIGAPGKESEEQSQEESQTSFPPYEGLHRQDMEKVQDSELMANICNVSMETYLLLCADAFRSAEQDHRPLKFLCDVVKRMHKPA
jgi:hypothetical protein